MEQFTANEVLRKLRERFTSGNSVPVPDVRLTRAEFDALADLLEAQEKAKPVATVEDQFGFPIMEWIGDAGEKCPVGTNLYTHSAQAQPPAASVTDAMVERAFDKLLADGLDDLDRPKIEGMRAALEAALAAQENPNG